MGDDLDKMTTNELIKELESLTGKATRRRLPDGLKKAIREEREKKRNKTQAATKEKSSQKKTSLPQKKTSPPNLPSSPRNSPKSSPRKPSPPKASPRRGDMDKGRKASQRTSPPTSPRKTKASPPFDGFVTQALTTQALRQVLDGEENPTPQTVYQKAMELAREKGHGFPEMKDFNSYLSHAYSSVERGRREASPKWLKTDYARRGEDGVWRDMTTEDKKEVLREVWRRDMTTEDKNELCGVSPSAAGSKGELLLALIDPMPKRDQAWVLQIICAMAAQRVSVPDDIQRVLGDCNQRLFNPQRQIMRLGELPRWMRVKTSQQWNADLVSFVRRHPIILYSLLDYSDLDLSRDVNQDLIATRSAMFPNYENDTWWTLFGGHSGSTLFLNENTVRQALRQLDKLIKSTLPRFSESIEGKWWDFGTLNKLREHILVPLYGSVNTLLTRIRSTRHIHITTTTQPRR